MPLSASPHLLPAAEFAGENDPQEEHKVVCSPELATRTQTSPPTTPQPREDNMTMFTAHRSIAPSDSYLAQHAFMTPIPDSMQWSTQGCLIPQTPVQDSSAFCPSSYHNFNSSHADYAHQTRNDGRYIANQSSQPPVDWTAPRLPDFGHVDLSGLPKDAAPSYPPSAFLHTPLDRSTALSLPDNSMSELMQLTDDYDLRFANYLHQEDQYDYTSPYSGISRASTPHLANQEEDEPIDKEQPYAQLIYRALLAAPQHTMVLRDIYDWFKMHTDKAAHSETKGWQNSIRHNLSMNGAFEKVDSPADAFSKGFMWRLTPAALREGVKSTTRYRSKAPNKRSTTRTTPLPQRQASGAKGGHAARRAASLRRSQRARDLAHYTTSAMPRSDPYRTAAYPTEWDGPYTPSNPYPSRTNSPYSQVSFSPYNVGKDHASFSPMMDVASHLVSPPRSYANSPTAPEAFMVEPAYVLEQGPGELFSGSPTPPVEEPVTPVKARGEAGWEQDVPLGIDVFDDLVGFGSGM